MRRLKRESVREMKKKWVLCSTRLHGQHGDGLRYGLVHIVDQYRTLVGKLQQNDRHNATVPPHTQTLDPEFPAERVNTNSTRRFKATGFKMAEAGTTLKGDRESG